MSESAEQTHEDHLRDVDRVLLYVSEAHVKAEEMAERLAHAGAEDRIVTALRTTAAAISAEHKRLMNSTFYSVPAEQEQIQVGESDPEQEQLAV